VTIDSGVLLPQAVAGLAATPYTGQQRRLKWIAKSPGIDQSSHIWRLKDTHCTRLLAERPGSLVISRTFVWTGPSSPATAGTSYSTMSQTVELSICLTIVTITVRAVRFYLVFNASSSIVLYSLIVLYQRIFWASVSAECLPCRSVRQTMSLCSAPLLLFYCLFVWNRVTNWLLDSIYFTSVFRHY